MYDIDKAIDELGNISSDMRRTASEYRRSRIVLGGDGNFSMNGSPISPFEVLQRMESIRKLLYDESTAIDVVINNMQSYLTD
jgi:hypothetical protein